MLDFFGVFTRGGALLWVLQMANAVRGSPLDSFIRSCLLEERSGQGDYTYEPPAGAAYTLKWTLHNGLGLIFVAVFQKNLQLLYVDALLDAVKADFSPLVAPRKFNFPGYEKRFLEILKKCEATAERQSQKKPKEAGAPSPVVQNNKKADRPKADAFESKESQATAGAYVDLYGNTEPEKSHETSAFNRQRLLSKTKAGKAAGVVPVGKSTGTAPAKKPSMTKKKEARKWPGSASDLQTLDYSEPAVPNGEKAGALPVDLQQSLVDAESEGEDYSEDEEEEAEPGKGGGGGASFLSSLARRVGVATGGGALTREDTQPALEALKRKLMERNVAEEIASQLCESVGTSLEGHKLSSFTSIKGEVARSLEQALTRILTPHRSVDILREVQNAKAAGRPYVITFVGVNGVGKSTNLAKIAYWLGGKGLKVLISACDTFRAGAVEQLKTHAARLGVPLYERGYEKDPAKVAAEAIRAAARDGMDVVLVDTAGRMQDNEPLMRALSGLINLNNPDLVLFVGEALVGNDAVDQLTKFNRRLVDLGTQARANNRAIDGLLVSKFDTVDDKVGAVISMVYASGAPVMFVGCGQSYADLRRLNVKTVVRQLLK